jgi:hypothetical protein
MSIADDHHLFTLPPTYLAITTEPYTFHYYYHYYYYLPTCQLPVMLPAMPIVDQTRSDQIAQIRSPRSLRSVKW